MQKPNKPSIFESKYLNSIEIIGWLLCITSMLLIVFVKDILPEMLPYAWAGAIVGAGLIGWGAGRKHQRK